jgi:hypothetical protein
MTYTVDFTDGTKSPITVSNGNVDTTTSVGLVGQGYNNYGEIIAEDLLHILENFASGSAPAKPVEGQIWYKNTDNTLYYFDDTVANSGNWKALASMTVQQTAPTAVGELNGHFWLDSNTGELYLYFNGSWVSIANSGGTTRVVTRQRYDTNDVVHSTIEFIANGEIVTITSSDLTAWQPQSSGANTEYLEDGTTLLNTHFADINPGQNMNQQNGYLFSGVALEALYADVAERYHADAEYVYGTVVKIGGRNEITQTTHKNDSDVFGVVSENPAVRMNSGAGPDSTHPFIALTGRIPVRVVGKVSKGSRLITSDVAGHAIATDIWPIASHLIIGRALEDKIIDEPGIIEAVVGVK